MLKGDLTGLKGTVVAISENGLITFKPIGVPKITKPLEIDAQNVCKYFEPGDLVRVIEAKYKGVLDVDGPNVSVVLDQT